MADAALAPVGVRGVWPTIQCGGSFKGSTDGSLWCFPSNGYSVNLVGSSHTLIREKDIENVFSL